MLPVSHALILFVSSGEGEEEFSMLSVTPLIWVETNTADSGHNRDLSLDRQAMQNVFFP